ncbi:unnamed protein product [Paramecium octaurelia]|uniref:Protein kinase domain-containing protein n=1 Tax=Paramecium octaurelia TaxID=43137 RepID=A0A8S1X697_PAROT|nr:unnamed protein product [Paramecium octaurelia]
MLRNNANESYEADDDKYQRIANWRNDKGLQDNQSMLQKNMLTNLSEMKICTLDLEIEKDNSQSNQIRLIQIIKSILSSQKCNIIHADIKAYNILISADTKLLKLFDFGTAFNVEYLVNRYYRASQIILVTLKILHQCLGHSTHCLNSVQGNSCSLEAIIRTS